MTNFPTAAESIALCKAQGSYEAAVEAARSAPPLPDVAVSLLRAMGLRTAKPGLAVAS